MSQAIDGAWHYHGLGYVDDTCCLRLHLHRGNFDRPVVWAGPRRNRLDGGTRVWYTSGSTDDIRHK